MIRFFYEEVSDNQIDEYSIQEWIRSIILAKNFIAKDINFIFCTDEYLIDINRQYLNHDYYTDIITFDYCSGKNISGDIFISIDTVLSNSLKYNSSYLTELHRVIIHGILHLIGYCDKSDSEQLIMRQEEDNALSRLKTFS